MNDMSAISAARINWKPLAPEARQVNPIPKGTRLPDFSRHPHFKIAYPYHTAEGNLAMVIVRYEEPDQKHSGRFNKKFFPFTLWRNLDGSLCWAPRSYQGKKPLFQLPKLLSRPKALVILSEGEKCAEAIGAMLPTCVSTTWQGGSNSVQNTDFSPLEGRNVLIFPDHDMPGYAAARTLETVLVDVGADRIRVLDMEALGKITSGEVPQGYDIADAIADGLTSDIIKMILQKHPEMLKDVPRAAPFSPTQPNDALATLTPAAPDLDIKGPETLSATDKDAVESAEYAFLTYLKKDWKWSGNVLEGYELSDHGLFKHGLSARGVQVTTFVGSPIAVIGQSRPAEGGPGWGRIVVFPRPDGTYVTLILPLDLGVGDGRELRKILAQHGFRCPNDQAGRLALANYIAHSEAPNIVEITSRPGWVGNSFAFPQGVISPPDETRQIKLDMGDKAHFFHTEGKPEDWRTLTGLVEMSSRAAFALSVAFSALLLKPLSESGGGFHFYGRSSRSKTTLLILAGSVFGGGGNDGFVQSWLRTGNSAEATAADHNDCLIVLDELGQSDPELASDLYYMLANGHGKGRATVLGTSRPSVQWRAMALSSGEDSSSVHMRSGARGAKKRLTGGVAVRMVDIPIEIAPGQTFESLGGFQSEGLLAEHVGREARRVYGHGGPAFIRELLKDRDAHLATAREIKDRFVATVTESGDDPQVRRIAGRFGLVAAAGSLATQFGVLPWQNESAFDATLACFKSWRDTRETSRSEEERDALRVLRRFFELYGRSRFEAITPTRNLGEGQEVLHDDDRPVRDRCGYRTTDDDGNTLLYVTPEAFRTEICDGHSPEIMLRVARDQEALVPGDGSHLQKNVRLPGHGGTSRVYAFLPHRFNAHETRR